MINENTNKKLACNCCFGEEYPSINGKTVIGCTEDNVWCNDCIAEKCEMYVDKNDASDDKRMYYAGVDMTDLDCCDCELWEQGKEDGTCVHYISNTCPCGYHDEDDHIKE